MASQFGFGWHKHYRSQQEWYCNHPENGRVRILLYDYYGDDKWFASMFCLETGIFLGNEPVGEKYFDTKISDPPKIKLKKKNPYIPYKTIIKLNNEGLYGDLKRN